MVRQYTVPKGIVANQAKINSMTTVLITEDGDWLRIVDEDQQGGALRAS